MEQTVFESHACQGELHSIGRLVLVFELSPCSMRGKVQRDLEAREAGERRLLLLS